MSSQKSINLKSFPFIKLISSLMIIIGAIFTYILSMPIPGFNPEISFFQVGGVQHGLVLGVPSLLSGLVLLLYTFYIYYKFSITDEEDTLSFKARKKTFSINKNDIVVVRVRDAGKSFIWFVFAFITFLFVYYGFETGLYFSANHNSGLYGFIIIPLFIIWLGGVLLVLFPRKLMAIITKDAVLLQKINHLPKDQSFEKLIDTVFGFKDFESNYNKTTQYKHRLILGVISLLIFIITSILVPKSGLWLPLHDIGIFLPIFLLIFSVLMISSSLSSANKQSIQVDDNLLRLEETSNISKLSGKNFVWFKSSQKVDEKNYVREFRTITKYDAVIICILFGGAFFLGFKLLWNIPLFLPYFSWIDLLISLILLLIIFLYQFEVVDKLKVPYEADQQLVKEIIIADSYARITREEPRSLKEKIKLSIKNYKNDFKSSTKTDSFKSHILKVGLIYSISLLLITISFTFFGVILFIFV